MLLECLIRLDENKTDDKTKEESLVTQQVLEEPKSLVSKDPEPEAEQEPVPEPEPQPKSEPKQTRRALPPPREFVARGPDRQVWNSIGLNDYDPGPAIQPTSDDTFLESIQSGTRSPPVTATLQEAPLSRNKAAVDVKATKSSVRDVAGKNWERKQDSRSKSEKAQMVKPKVDGQGDVVVPTGAAGRDGYFPILSIWRQ